MPMALAASAERRATRAARIAGALAAITCALVLAGWFLDVALLRTVVPGEVSMKPNAAIGLGLLGLGFALPYRRRLTSQVLAGAAVVVAVATLVQYLLGVDLGIDEAVHHEVPDPVRTVAPGRMAATTALSILLVGVAVLLQGRPTRTRVGLAHVIALAPLGMGLVSMVGYAYGESALIDGGARYTAMAVNTAVVVVALGVAALLVEPGKGLVAPFTGVHLQARYARWALVLALGVPFALGLLRLRMQREGLVGTELGTALFAVSNMVVFAGLIVIGLRALLRADAARAAIDAELTANRRQAQDLLDRAPMGISAKDLDGRFLVANRAAAEMIGAPPDGVVGLTDADLSPDDVATRIRRRDLHVLRTATAVENEIVHDGPDGNRILRSLRFPLVRDGDIYGVGTISMDVTERRRIERERDKLELRIRQIERLDSLGQLAGGISHDFNNVLAIIHNYAALLERDLTDPRSRADVAAIREAAEKGTDLVRQLLAFSRREPEEPLVMAVADVVESVVALLNRTMPQHVAIDVAPCPSGCDVSADPGQIEQVLVNLIVNARDAMPEGGTITIEVDAVDLGSAAGADLVGLTPGRYVRLAVSDGGAGMSAEVRDRAFEPFFTTKPDGAGTGLGLATVYGIVKQSGGHALIYSEPNRGTVVKVYLPLVSPPSGPPAVAPAGAYRGSGQRVLVVEDDPSLRVAIERMLADAGYAAVAVPSGEDALSTLRTTGSPDVLVTDMVLPGLTGPELAERLRIMAPSVRVLLVSGYTTRTLRPDEVSSAAVTLEKPFALETLLAHVAELAGAGSRGS